MYIKFKLDLYVGKILEGQGEGRGGFEDGDRQNRREKCLRRRNCGDRGGV